MYVCLSTEFCRNYSAAPPHVTRSGLMGQGGTHYIFGQPGQKYPRQDQKVGCPAILQLLSDGGRGEKKKKPNNNSDMLPKMTSHNAPAGKLPGP